EHFFNSSAAAIDIAVSLRLDCKSTPPPQPSRIFEFVNSDAHDVGPAEQLTVSGDCGFDRKITVLRLFRPPLRMISTFSATRDHEEQPFWSNNEWSIAVSPPLERSKGKSLQWSCGYRN